jgi:membrane protein
MASSGESYDTRQSLLGAAIATGLALYVGARERRERRLSAAQRAGNGGYGRSADEPHEIPAPGWWDITKRVFESIGQDNVSLMAAGLAFYAMLSLTPAFTALIALYGLVFDPSQVQRQIQTMESFIPPEAAKLIGDQLAAVVQASNSKLGVGLIVSLGIALWSANSGTTALMSALNVAYGEAEKRGTLEYWMHSLLLTASLIVFGILSIVLIAVIPAVIGLLPFGDFGQTIVSWLRWPVLVLLSTIGLAIIYRYAPSRAEPRWSWVSWGAFAATVLWLVGSALFSLYVGKFASYNKTYGSLGAVVVLLMWLWLTGYAIIMGAELNAEMEHQTARDTTTPPRQPMGMRGAYVADTLAKR